jgi:Tfp pilus assembly protein PilZ
MDLENIVSEISMTQKDKNTLYDSIYMTYLEQTNSNRQKVERIYQEPWREIKRQQIFFWTY